MDGHQRRIIFLASREADYSRIQVIGKALKARFQVEEFVSKRRGYLLRIVEVVGRFIFRRRQPADVLVVGFLAQPILPLLRLLWKGPLVSDAFISLKDTLIDDRELGPPGGLLERIATFLDRFTVRHSELILCDTQAHVRYFESHFGPTRAKFCRIWVGSPELPPGTPLWSRTIRTGAPLRVFFYGSFLPLQGTGIIVEAAVGIPPELMVLRMAGEGPMYNRARKIAADCGHITFLGWQTAGQLIEEMLQADLCLGVFGGSEKASRIIPNKAYSAMQLGVPLLTGDSPGIREILVPGRSAVVCPMNDPAGLARSILWCSDHRDELPPIGLSGREAFEKNASASALADLVEGAINGLLDRKPVDPTVSRGSGRSP